MLPRKKYLMVGIDEAGRGSLAGPLVVAAVSVKDPRLVYQLARPNPKLGELRDSKRLSSKKRELWYEYLTRHPNIRLATSFIYPKAIDRINVHQAAQLGVRRVLKKIREGRVKVFLDGNLFAPKDYIQETIIRGDTWHPLIMAASIIAKVSRDRIMLRFDKKYPLYSFKRHKGYGTDLHRFLVKRYGPSEIHRVSFLSKII